MNDFEIIKSQLNLRQVIIQETGLAMKGAHLEECPFCSGHECFSIKDDYYKCFQCDSGGDVFTFLEAFKKADKLEILKYAANIAGVKLKEPKKKDSAGLNLSIKDTIFLEAAKHYHSNVPMNGGKAYFIEQRKHKDEIINGMQVGWSTGDLTDYLFSKGFTPEQIKASGLAREKEIEGKTILKDFFGKGLAIFPHWERNRVIHFTMKDPSKKLEYQLPNDFRSKEWRFYNQDSLGKFNEVIIVEGENDLLSILDAGMQSAIGLIGTPSEQQIKALKTYCASKHLYLWLDNDKSGKYFTRKICKELANSQNIRIITHGDEHKDPDEYLRAFTGDKVKEIKRLQNEALTYIGWEIAEIGKLDSLEKRLSALKERKIFAVVANMVEAEKQVYVEKLTLLGFTKDAIEDQLETNLDLRRELAIYFEQIPKKDADPNFIANIIFKHFSLQGQFFRDRMHDVYLLYQHFIYEVGNNRPFNALIAKTTGLLPTKEPGRSVWESIASLAYNNGKQIDLASWIYTDRATDAIYINLNSANNVIIKISSNNIQEIPNGINKEGVLLKSSKKILPMNYLPDINIKEGMQVLGDLIFQNMTCEKEQRYLILCWFISAFLLDFSPYMGLMKFSGPSASGKTTTARLLSLLIYGNEHLGDPSSAAAYAVSSQNPMLIIDNLESDDFTKSILKFLLLSATKGSKEKRTQGTDSDTIQEMPKALVLITAIEPFTKAELINRTYDIDFGFKFKSDDFVEDEIIREIIKKRDIIISAILKFISRDILPNLENRKEYITILKKEYKNHAKNRTDEYLSILMLMLHKLLNYISYYESDDFFYGIETGEKVIRQKWIEYQNAKARDTETTSNTILKLLDGLIREYIIRMSAIDPTYHKDYPDEPVFAYTHPEYMIEVIKTKPIICCSTCNKPTDGEDTEENTCKCVSSEHYSRAYIEFIATSQEIVQSFDRYCRNNGIKNPYDSASIFTARLKNDMLLLKKSNWTTVSKERCEPYWTRIHGERFWKFRKVVIK